MSDDVASSAPAELGRVTVGDMDFVLVLDACGRPLWCGVRYDVDAFLDRILTLETRVRELEAERDALAGKVEGYDQAIEEWRCAKDLGRHPKPHEA